MMIENFGLHNLNRELKLNQISSQLPPTVENVRQSCKALAYSPQCEVKIDENRVRQVVDSLDIESLKKASHYMEVSLDFPNEASEVNFHIVLHLFNFAHGYRHSLHAVRGAGAWQTMKRGLEVLQQHSSGMITASMLANLSREQIVDIFDLGAGSDSKIVAPVLEPLVKIVMAVANNSGRRLMELNMPNFATFAYSHCRHPQSGALSASWLVQQLATFPAFDDRRVDRNGKETLFLKKAQLAVAELYQRVSTRNAANFNFQDINRLTVVCDNVLPCVLRALGVLILPDELQSKIDSRQPLPAGFEEAELRATAITAVEMMIEQGQGSFWAKEIGDFFWSLGKEARYRSIERHATPDTCFY